MMTSEQLDDMPYVRNYTIDLEKNVLMSFLEILEQHLEKYTTTLEEDEEILQNKKDSLTFNLRNCLIMRISEKRILHFYIEFSEYCLSLIERSFDEAKDVLADDWGNNTSPYDLYLFDTLLPLLKG